MKTIKVTVNSEDRIVIIPIEYDETSDSAELKEVQVEPTPSADEDLSKDIVVTLSMAIINLLRNAD